MDHATWEQIAKWVAGVVGAFVGGYSMVKGLKLWKALGSGSSRDDSDAGPIYKGKERRVEHKEFESLYGVVQRAIWDIEDLRRDLDVLGGRHTTLNERLVEAIADLRHIEKQLESRRFGSGAS